MIPSHLIESLNRWVERGIWTGGFLRAVLENDLVTAVSRSGEDVSLREVVTYVVAELPSACWGSRAKVEAWEDRQQRERRAELQP